VPDRQKEMPFGGVGQPIASHARTRAAPQERPGAMQTLGRVPDHPAWIVLPSVASSDDSPRIQTAQSAFRIYPGDVDLTKAQAPIDVLAAFSAVFGVSVHAGDRAAKFIEAVTVPKNPITGQAIFNVKAEMVPGVEHFISWTQRVTTSNTSMMLSLLYCINWRNTAPASSGMGLLMR
jgi:hypothetical protein